MWELQLMLKGWLDLVLELRGLLWRLALVAGSAIAAYAMVRNGTTG